MAQHVFLFVDSGAFDSSAERAGNLAFHRLVSRFVSDSTDPIVKASGEIYRYVGEELIANWGLADRHSQGSLCARLF
jgi:adenylate cyclase